MAELLADLPLGRILPVGPFGAPGPAGVVLRTLTRSTCALVAGRDRAALFAALKASVGVDLADAPNVFAAPDAEFIGTGPGCWLVLSQRSDLFALLERAAGAAGSIFEQSGGLVILEAAGADLPRALAKLIPLDLHPRVFPAGAAATTTTAHVNLTVWRADEEHWRFSVARSYFAALLRAFASAAAEFGFGWRG